MILLMGKSLYSENYGLTYERFDCHEVETTPIQLAGIIEISQRPEAMDKCFALVEGDMERDKLEFADKCRLADGTYVRVDED